VAAGTVEADFVCARAGEYAVAVKGYSKPAQKVYGVAEIKIDGRTVGEVEVASPNSTQFAVGNATLSKGPHTVALRYTNDVQKDGEDRNLYINAVGFRAQE